MVDGGGMVDGSSMVSRGGMMNRGSMVGRGGMINLRIGSISLVGDISNIAIVATSGVLDVLGPAVRKSNRVGALDIAVVITSLSSVEGSLGVVVSNSVLEGVGLGGLVIGNGVVGGGMVGGSGVVHSGSVVG